MERTIIVNMPISDVASYLEQITTFEGAVPQRQDRAEGAIPEGWAVLPMSSDDRGKPIPPSVPIEHGVISIQSIQQRALSKVCIKLWMDAQSWHVPSPGLISLGNTLGEVIIFTLESITEGTGTRLILECKREEFQEYSNEIARLVVQRFSNAQNTIIASIPADSPKQLEISKKTALKGAIDEADTVFQARGDDNWWRHVLNFQNDWNNSHKGDRITNEDLADAACVAVGTVKNSRTRLGFSKKTNTRTDLRRR